MVLGLDACEYPTAFLVRWVMVMFHHQTMHVEQGGFFHLQPTGCAFNNIQPQPAA